jgi:putative sigma-54 modulation protein
MRIMINGKGMEVSDYMKDVVEKRLSKLDKLFREDVEAQVMLSMLRGRHVCEITIPFHGVVLRGEEASGDMYASIDNVCNKIERQIRRQRTRLEKRLHDSGVKYDTGLLNGVREKDEFEREDMPSIVRTKRFAIKPMDADEAAMQMDLLGHEFFVFSNAETNEVNVIYKRRDGDYGLIEPEYE